MKNVFERLSELEHDQEWAYYELGPVWGRPPPHHEARLHPGKTTHIARVIFYVLRAAFVGLLIGALASGCASTPQAPAAPKYRAPWADSGKLEFRYLLASFGATNLTIRPDDTLDRYLRSQTKTFDRYVAAKEVGVGVAPLQQEAAAEIQAASAELRFQLFLVRTSFTVQAYNAQLGGFPLYQQPFDLNASLHYTNEDVRTTRSTNGSTRGMSVISKDYGFTDAEVWFSKVGWIVPATPDQAVRMLENLSQVGGERKVAVAMTYMLDRCDPADNEQGRLVCKASIRAMYGYSGLDAAQPDARPVVELVHRNGG